MATDREGVSMDKIVIIEGDELDYFFTQMVWMAGEGMAIRIRVAIDEGAFKFKVNERTWSRPIGRLAPESVTGYGCRCPSGCQH